MSRRLKRVKLNDPKVTEVYFNENDDAVEVGKALVANTNVREVIILMEQGIGVQGCAALAHALESNTTVTGLSVFYGIIDLEHANVFATMLQRNKTTLTRFHIAHCSMGSDAIVAILDAMSYNTVVTHLLLSHFTKNHDSDASTKQAEKICQLLQRNATLRCLKMTDCALDDEFAIGLAKGMTVNNTLKELDLDRNRIHGRDGAIAMSEVLAYNTTLQILHLSSNFIGDEFFEVFAKGLMFNKSLKELHMNKNHIHCFKGLTRSLRFNNTLERLSLDGDAVSNDRLISSFSLFQLNESLTHVTLPEPYSTHSAAKEKLALYLNQVFYCNDTLVSINRCFQDDLTKRILRWNKDRDRVAPNKGAMKREVIYHWMMKEWIGCVNAFEQRNILLNRLLTGYDIGTEFVHGFSPDRYTNTTLQALDFSDNNITTIDRAGAALADMLRHNTQLKALYLSTNNIGDDFIETIADGLQYNYTLQILDLSYNRIGYRGVVALMEALEHKLPITKLDLAENLVNDASATSIAKFLRYNRTLEQFDLCNNRLRDNGVRTILAAMEYNESLKSVFLWGNAINQRNKLQRLLRTVEESNDTLEQCYFHFSTRFGSTLPRVAPKKVIRKRYESFSWLLSEWVNGRQI